MRDKNHILSVQVLDRSYKIKCHQDEAHELRESAQYVDIQMRQIRQASSITNTDRIAVVASLNVVHDLLKLKKQNALLLARLNERVEELSLRIQEVLEVDKEVAV